jgi:hypothetical protein
MKRSGARSLSKEFLVIIRLQMNIVIQVVADTALNFLQAIPQRPKITVRNIVVAVQHLYRCWLVQNHQTAAYHQAAAQSANQPCCSLSAANGWPQKRGVHAVSSYDTWRRPWFPGKFRQGWPLMSEPPWKTSRRRVAWLVRFRKSRAKSTLGGIGALLFGILTIAQASRGFSEDCSDFLKKNCFVSLPPCTED